MHRIAYSSLVDAPLLRPAFKKPVCVNWMLQPELLTLDRLLGQKLWFSRRNTSRALCFTRGPRKKKAETKGREAFGQRSRVVKEL